MSSEVIHIPFTLLTRAASPLPDYATLIGFLALGIGIFSLMLFIEGLVEEDMKPALPISLVMALCTVGLVVWSNNLYNEAPPKPPSEQEQLITALEGEGFKILGDESLMSGDNAQGLLAQAPQCDEGPARVRALDQANGMATFLVTCT